MTRNVTLFCLKKYSGCTLNLHLRLVPLPSQHIDDLDNSELWDVDFYRYNTVPLGTPQISKQGLLKIWNAQCVFEVSYISRAIKLY